MIGRNKVRKDRPKVELNLCDWGHETPNEIRLLPTGADGNALACKGHWRSEMKYRHEVTGGDRPEWESLKVYQEAVRTAKADTGTTPAAYHLVIDKPNAALEFKLENPLVASIRLPDSGGKQSHPIYLTTKAYDTKAKVFALVITQNGFIKVKCID